jgi:hypothetical protein
MSGTEAFHPMFRFVLAALATWRLAFLLVREDGPWDLSARLRRWLGEGFFGKLSGCVKCISFWVAFPLAFFVGGSWVELIVVWLALAGVTALIDEWTRPPFTWQEETPDELLRSDSNRPAD